MDESSFTKAIPAMFKAAEHIRKDDKHAIEASLGSVFAAQTELAPEKNGMEALLHEIGIDVHTDTIENVLTLPTDAPKWIVPEIIRDAITVGLRKAPVYPNIIAAEETINGTSISMPHMNLSDAAPRYVEEGETITLGAISYGTKSLKIRKMGRGIGFTDEFKLYTTLNAVSIFLRDFGVKLGYALDGLAIDVLINGEQTDGSASAPVIGVTTVNTIVYKDLVRIWVRLARMGRVATTMVAGEDMAMDILDMDAFKVRQSGTTEAKLNLKTVIPASASLFIHGAIPDDQVVILDPQNTMIKYNARPLLIESERIVSNQTQNTYASLTTGFGTMFRDSRVILDKSVTFLSTGFPAYMNVDLFEASELKD